MLKANYSMKDSFLIVDGLNYLFRAYFGITDAIKTKSGVSINAVYGFFAFLRKSVESVNPKYLVIIFDSENAAKSKQQDLVSYKANRKYEDIGMFAQLRIIKSILDLMNIRYLEEDKVEADDLIGTYCNFGREQNCSVYVSSNDFDFMQLISEDVFVVRNFKKEQQVFTVDEVKTRFGVSPKAYPDYAALLGDKSDNIEGVKGIGKKTAREIITKYNSVENLIGNIDLLPDKLRTKVRENITKIVINKKMITINVLVTDNLIQLTHFEFIRDDLNLKTSNYINKLKI